jgi:flagellar hook-associated protein 2
MADSTVSSLLSSQYYQPSITFTGLGSGFDSASVIEKLVQVESAQITRMEKWKEEWTAKISALEKLNSLLSDFRSAVQAMNTPGKFQAKTVTVSDSNILSATVSAEAAAGSHQVLVNQLAQGEVEVHAGLAAADTVVNGSGSDRVFAFSYAGGASVSITVPDGTTLSGLATLINSSGANPGVTATVLDMGPAYTTDRYRLVLKGDDLGAGNTIVIDDGLTSLDGTGGTENFTSAQFTETQTAQNAQVRLDGYPPAGWIERSSNTIGDLISGVSLSLLAPSATAVQVTVAHDSEAMQEKILSLVEAYNQVVAYIKEQTKYDTTTGQAGILLGNYGVQLVKGALATIATGTAPGFKDPQDTYTHLAQLGITTDADQNSPTFGQLVVDEATLRAALVAHPEAVADLMAASFEGVSDDTSGVISYYSSIPGITKPGIYQVSATVTGGVLVSGTINGHAATVDGDTLVGAAGYDEYGLAVRVGLTDGTHTGTVRLKQGVNGVFSNRLKDLLSASSGPTSIIIDNYQEIIENIDEKIAREQLRVEAYRQRLVEQFSRLEEILSTLNQQSNSLNYQLQKLGFKTDTTS